MLYVIPIIGDMLEIFNTYYTMHHDFRERRLILYRVQFTGWNYLHFLAKETDLRCQEKQISTSCTF